MIQLNHKDPVRWWIKHPVLEGLFTLIAATAAVLPPLNDPKIALTIAIIGILFAIGRYGVQELIKENLLEKIDQKFDKVDKLANIVDLTFNSNIGEIKPLAESYAKITHPEFFDIKSEIISSTLSRLDNLLTVQRTENLNTGAYYHILIGMLNSVKKSETIYAVSTGQSVEWENTPEEENFFKANLNIVDRGGTVVRFFIYDRPALLEALSSNEKVKEHFGSGRLTGYFVDKSKLEKKDKLLFNALGHGFLMIENRVAMVDVFDAEPRGYLTKNIHDLKIFNNAVNQLKEMGSRTV